MKELVLITLTLALILCGVTALRSRWDGIIFSIMFWVWLIAMVVFGIGWWKGN